MLLDLLVFLVPELICLRSELLRVDFFILLNFEVRRVFGFLNLLLLLGILKILGKPTLSFRCMFLVVLM